MTTVSQYSFNASSGLEKEECPYLYDVVWRRNYLTEHTYRNLVVIACINFVSVLPTILLNALVIFVVANSHRLQTNANILLSSLAGTDLLTGLVVQPISVAVQIKRIRSVGPFCIFEKLFALAYSVLSFASLSNLVLLSVERYIAVKYSLRYQDIVTKQRLMAVVLLVWGFTVVLTLQEIPLAVTDSVSASYMIAKDSLFTIMCLSYLAVILYNNCYIYSEAQRQKRRIQTEQVNYEEAKRMKKDKKAANTLAIILAVLTLTYLPMFIFILVTSLDDSIVKPRGISIIWSWTSTLVMLGSLFNPVIYCWRIKKLRRAFLEVLHCRKRATKQVGRH